MAWDRKQRRKLSDAGNWAFVTSNLSFLFFVVLAVAIMIASRAQIGIFDSAREAVNDAATPLYELAAQPAAMFKRWGQGLDSLLSVYEENQRLREENARLLAKQNELVELERKVARYEDLLKAQTDAPVASVAARVIADASGPFVHTVLVNAGHDQGIAKGQAVVDELGLIGRVIASGNRSARILLLTDLNSRIPVMVEGVNLKAILTGDNSVHPTLEYLPAGARIPAGARVVTTPDGGVFPPGIPVGVVASDSRAPRVNLYTGEGRADFVRILRYTAQVDVNSAPAEPLPGAITEQPAPGAAVAPTPEAVVPAAAVPTAQATPPVHATRRPPPKPKRTKPANLDEPFSPPAATAAAAPRPAVVQAASPTTN
ncbi:MAG: rod shape-determining protein MreC [Alphaproteobacteria bacterium]|nr:rod shape-determining protein MreC [Alphaproteobacteria bacterium]